MNCYPTVIGITETWLKKNSHDPCTELTNYALFSKSRSKFKGGGVEFFFHTGCAIIHQCLKKAAWNRYLLKLNWANLTLSAVTSIDHLLTIAI